MKKLVDQWNKAAEKYTKDQEQSDFVESNKQIVKARFKDMTGQKVLDLGCGYGYYTDYFQNIGAEVIGIDGGWCVSLTAIGAVKAGYRVIMNESAIGTIYHKRKEVFSKKLRNANVKFI